MENAEVEKTTGSEETTTLNRNRSFKSKQLVRSQAIRESQSPPRAISPDPAGVDAGPADPGSERGDPDNSSHCSDNVGDVKIGDDDKKQAPVEIQITSGAWESEAHVDSRGARRWLAHAHSESSRDLLSNSPRVACVCGACANCPHCRGRRRRHLCPTKQDSGIVCSDDCPDCSDTELSGNGSNSDLIRKSGSLDVDEHVYYCRCPERKDRPKNISLNERFEPTGPELVNFIKETLNKNARDRIALLKIEKELHALVNDTGRCIVRFPVMTSYGRMLVHRCAALFQLSHHLDQGSKTSVLVSKSGTSGGRIPCTSFKEWCVASFPPSPQRHQPDAHAKSILKRAAHSLDEPGAAMSGPRSKSLEQRERDYERVRRRIFSSDNCSQQDESQWPWLSAGPVKLLTPESGRNKLLKVQSLESSGSGWRGRGAVSKSHSFGGYAQHEPPPHRLLSRQGDLASSSWRLSPSSSGYKTLSLRSTDSITPSPTGGGSPEPGAERACVVWCVTDMAAVPPGALVIHPQTGRPLTNSDGSVYHFDPANPPVLYDPSPTHSTHNEQKLDQNNEKRRGKLEKQHSFIDHDCECQPSEECRSKCCCECRRHDAGQQRTTSEKETNTKPQSPNRYDSNHTQETNQKPSFEIPTNHKPSPETNQRQQDTTTNQRPVYDNQPTKQFEVQRSFETTNQRPGNDVTVNRQAKLTNQDSREMYTQGYVQGYRGDEFGYQMTSPPQMNHYIQADAMQAMVQQPKIPAVPMQDPNMRPMSLTNMVYPTAVAQGYPYQCRIDQQVQPVYQTLLQPPEEQKQLAPSPHTGENTFRIDPSYPYAAVDYTAACGACVDTASLQHQQRSYSVPYGQMEVPQMLPPYPVGNVILPQPHIQPYPYQESLPWTGVGAAAKVLVPELYPVLPPHYGLLYPQVIPQPYPVCQPVYPLLDKQAEPPRRNSVASARLSKRNSVSGSARNTPSQEEKVPYEEKNTEIAAKIQQIKQQMAQLNTRDTRTTRDDWRRPNPGLPANCPGNKCTGRVPGRTSNDESQLSSAARAIVNSIRNMQAKNTYQDGRRPDRYDRFEGHKDRRRDRDDRRPPHDNTRPELPLYRQPYLLRQMSPGTWCRRSPGPVHPVLNHPRRPHPDTRNGRR